jgi:flagellar basal-body rod protein FlgG
LYTRGGNFSINANSELVLGSASSGKKLFPPVTLNQGDTNFTVAPDGQISVTNAGSTTPTPVAQLQLATFQNPEGLLKLGDNLYAATDASGQVQQNTPGLQGTGQIRQGALEASNVEPVQELIDLITTQRSFELNSQAIQAGDQILQLISNLRR